MTSTTPAVAAILAVLALGETVLAFLLWARGVSQVPAGTAAVFTGMIPVTALALSAVVLGESVTGGHLVAAALVIAGIVVLARAR